MRHLYFCEHRDQLLMIKAPGRQQEITNPQGQDRVDMQFLRNIADLYSRLAVDFAARCIFKPEQYAYQTGFSCPVGPDQGDGLTPVQLQRYIIEDLVTSDRITEVFSGYQHFIAGVIAHVIACNGCTGP